MRAPDHLVLLEPLFGKGTQVAEDAHVVLQHGEKKHSLQVDVRKPLPEKKTPNITFG